MHKRLLLIFFLAFFIRLIALNQSLWLDEATTAKVVHDYSYTGIITKFSPSDFHPPLYYLFMKLWTNIFGYSEIALRMPSVLFSLLTGWIIYKICRLRPRFGEPMWATVFFLFNPLIVYYSQEARMYMMVTMFLTASLYYLLKSWRVNELTNSFLFIIFSILAFYTFYGSIFLIIPMLLYLLYKKKYQSFVASCFMFCVSLLILSPLLYRQFNNAQKSLQIVLNWKSVLGTATLKNLLLIPLKFSFGRISFYPKWLYWGLSGIWGVFVWSFAIKGGLKNKLLTFLLVSPLVIGLLFSFFSPLLQYFRFLYLIPLMAILLAKGIKITIYQYIVIGGFLILSLAYLINPAFHREDWKSLSQTLENTRFVYMISSSSDPLTYYAPRISVRDIRTFKGIELEKTVTVIPYTTDIYGFDYKIELKKKGFTYKETKSFRGVWYEIWVRNKDYAGSFRYSLKTARV